MLVLTRKTDEEIIIDGNIRVKVLEVRGDRVRLGICAPPEVPVHRAEVQQRIQFGDVESRENRPASEPELLVC